jgi:hypothetical protein
VNRARRGPGARSVSCGPSGLLLVGGLSRGLGLALQLRNALIQSVKALRCQGDSLARPLTDEHQRLVHISGAEYRVVTAEGQVALGADSHLPG